MHNASRQEPIGNTCPLINRTLKELEEAEQEMESVLNCCRDALKDEHVKVLDDIRGFLHDLQANSGPLEELRDANDKLRKWGNELAHDLSLADDIVQELEHKLEQVN